jgi:hypothetical protein
MFAYHDVTDASDTAMQQPLCWITNAFDRSPAELLWVPNNSWGPLQGSLLNLSYGYGKVFVVPYETIDGQKQGGMCELPIAAFPTGVMRGRFNPHDGHLYTCGMFAWAGSVTEPGGFYRIRYTGRPVHLPVAIHAFRGGLALRFSGQLNPSSTNPERIAIKTWSLKRTADYGSKHHDEKQLRVQSVTLSEDRQTLCVELPEIQPTWCMEIKYSLETTDGERLDGTIHNTIHKLAQSQLNAGD